MKKLLRTLLLTALLTAALCVCALAAEPTTAGIYGISSTDTSVTLTPKTAADEGITAATFEGYTGSYYADAVKLEVSATGLTANNQYLVLVLKGAASTITADSIVYIDQAAADASGKITFTAYPSALTKGSYKVFILGNGRPFSAGAAVTFYFHQPYTLGDVNGDTSIDSKDALLALQAYGGILEMTDVQKLAADANNDKAVDAKDALMILQHYAHLIEF